MSFNIRPMNADDVNSVEEVWRAAFEPMRASGGEPVVTPTPEEVEYERRRFRHVVSTDPEGCFVAESRGAILGLCQSLRRSHQFVLSRLGVTPEAQEQGIGRSLLAHALAYAGNDTEQFIWSSRDPRAMHSYVREGFDLHPTVHIAGRPRSVVVPRSIRRATNDDIVAIDTIDIEQRGISRRSDIELWMALGAQAIIDDDGGYLLFRNGRLTALCALDVTIASRMLELALCGTEELAPLEVGWVTAEQQWAITSASRAGASLSIRGAMLSRRAREYVVPYLPSPAYG